jgi:hypothetical protein
MYQPVQLQARYGVLLEAHRGQPSATHNDIVFLRLLCAASRSVMASRDFPEVDTEFVNRPPVVFSKNGYRIQ